MNSEPKRILIIEDSDIFAQMLMGFLGSFNYSLERAVNGFEGIKKVYSFLPQLIISDIEMPLFKGYQVTRFLKSRKNTKAIPVIMFTSLSETKDKFWGNRAGADIYIEKSPDNFKILEDAISDILSVEREIDFSAIERERKKINDESIIEIVNNLLDNQLFQTTVTGMLVELSKKAQSLEMIVSGIFELLHTICEAEICAMMIHGSNGALYVFTANYSGFSVETANNFSEISISDFNNLFPDFQVSIKKIHRFFPEENNQKKLASYITIPLFTGGEIFASVHIANSINEYFTPAAMENINVFLGAASPVIANSLSMHELAELQKNTRIAFARYVPADVMDELIYGTSKKATMSEHRNVTVLFSDIRNFTSLSEHSDAQSVVDFLNIWFAKMGSEIISENGHIDKFIGDAIMAVFGGVQKLENSPKNAIKAAVKMIAAMDEINNSDSKISGNTINIGIGINYGECILGNIGFKNKMDYTIIGDTVNLASRIENLTKIYHYPIIVSEYVYEAAKDKFIFRKIDNVRVKGKGKPAGIYAVYSGFQGIDGKKLRSGEISDLPSVPCLLINRDTLLNYNKGLQVYKIREWKLAKEYFTNSLETDKNDFLSQLYLNRVIEYERTPPGDDWDGVFTLENK
jgi:class 3 adenylate cyclase/DNA-binding response OmpR family regulator